MNYIVILEHTHANKHLPAGLLYRVIREDHGCLIGSWSTNPLEATPLDLHDARETARRFIGAYIRKDARVTRPPAR